MKSNRKRDHISDAIRIRTLSFPMEFLNIVVNEFPHSADFIRKPWAAVKAVDDALELAASATDSFGCFTTFSARHATKIFVGRPHNQWIKALQSFAGSMARLRCVNCSWKICPTHDLIGFYWVQDLLSQEASVCSFLSIDYQTKNIDKRLSEL